MSKELQAGYKFTKAQLARLELLEKQNAVMLGALLEIGANSEDFGAIERAYDAIIKVTELES